MIATAVLCTRGRPELATEAIAHLARAVAAAGDAELLVVEQGGPELAAAAGAVGARHVHDPGRGVSRARNIGARHAAGDIVLYTDDDCIVPASWVSGHVLALADAEVTATFGVVSGLARGEGPDPVARRARHRVGAAPWDIGHSSNMAVRRAALLAVGGFDERLGPGAPGRAAGDDPDLIVRLLAAGAVIESGVGEPVVHVPWRDDAETRSTLLAYEWGAGAWLGASLRARRPYVARHVRIRLRMLRRLAREQWDAGSRSAPARLTGAFVLGLLHGVRLEPWPPGDQAWG